MNASPHRARLGALATVLAALLAPLSPASGAPAEPAAVRSEADLPRLAQPPPRWTVTDLEGREWSDETLKGKVVVIDFWATWCAPCVHEIPGYITLQEKHRERGLVVIGVSMDRRGREVVEPFAKRLGINYPLALATPEVLAALGGVDVLPTTLLIDREGRVRHRKVGAMATEDYEKLLLPLL